MKVIRFSVYGFKPQCQKYHLHNINLSLSEYLPSGLNEYQKACILSVYKRKNPFYKEHYKDFKNGIWVFRDGYKDRQSLNHLKKLVPCWEAELPDDTEVYDCNLERFIRLDNEITKFGGCYIPERELYKLNSINKR